MTSRVVPSSRWWQLLLGLICMVVISSPQYVWALFTQPLSSALGVTLPELQITFSILIVVQTFLSPWQGVFVDRFGPRALLSVGVLVTDSAGSSRRRPRPRRRCISPTDSLAASAPASCMWASSVHMVQWFPDKRGLATGLVAAGYGVGALLTTFPIAAVLRESSYQAALTRFGVMFAVIGFAAAQGLRRPDAAAQSAWNQRASAANPASGALAQSISAPARCWRRRSSGSCS
jgi:MFS family permease